MLIGSAIVATGGTKVLPVLNRPIQDQSAWIMSPLRLDLSSVFGTEEIDDEVVRFVSQFDLGGEPLVMDMALFSNRTPITRTNFLSYVNSGAYNNSFVHRSVPGFVIQGGASRVSNGAVVSIPTAPPIVNEFGVSNTLGTISMAKLGGDPNSATSQWFVSLGANSDILDPQNDGFTVFGRMTRSTLSTAQIFGDPGYFPTFDYGGIYQQIPFLYTHDPGILQFDEFVLFPQVSLVPIPEGQAGENKTLAYSVVSNSNSALLGASISADGALILNPLGSQSGVVELTVRATDSVGNIVDDEFQVSVNRAESYDQWASRSSFPNSSSGLNDNADRDEWDNLQEFAFLGDPMASDASGRAIFPGIAGASSSTKFLNLTFPVRKFVAGLSYSVEVSNGLSGTWSELWNSSNGFAHSQVHATLDLGDRTLLTIKDTQAIAGNSKRFMRVRVTRTP
jgi:cyclophilin family peptidyl-prolyl cis-trans isomerase